MKKSKLFLAVVALFSCGHSFHEGQIIEKIYEPEETSTFSYIQYVNDIPIVMYQTDVDDEDFIFRVKGKNRKGKTEIESFYVSENTWDCFEVGDYYNDTITCASHQYDEPKYR